MPRQSRCGDYLRPNGWLPGDAHMQEIADRIGLPRDEAGQISFEHEERIFRAAARTSSVKPYPTTPLLRATIANYNEIARLEDPTADERLERLEARIAPERERLAEAYGHDPEVDEDMAHDMATAQLDDEIREFFRGLATRELDIRDYQPLPLEATQ